MQTATISRPSSARRPAAGHGPATQAVVDRLAAALGTAEPGSRPTVVAALSGGADSTALLWGLTRLAAQRPLRLVAAHLDHALDPGSAERAEAAARLCRELGVELRRERLAVDRLRRNGESREQAARRLRYGFLEGQRRRLGARWLLTAHHRDDQAETVALRLLFGSGLVGLAGIDSRRGALLRPLLGVDRGLLRRALAEAGLEPIEDPTNADPTVPRNRVRRLLLPALEQHRPGIGRDLARLAQAATAARGRLEPLLRLRLGIGAEAGGARLARRRLAALPAPLWPFALVAAGRLAGVEHPTGSRRQAELVRQLAAGRRVGCDWGHGWRWIDHGDELRLVRPPAEVPPAPFRHRLLAPGSVEIGPHGRRFSLRRSPYEPWMLERSPRRAGLELPIAGGEPVTVRSRLPGDRLRPLGGAGSRKLKQLLIDRRVPRLERDRLPLLEVAGRIAWVPGVALDESCRPEPGRQVWLAEVVQP